MERDKYYELLIKISLPHSYSKGERKKTRWERERGRESREKADYNYMRYPPVVPTVDIGHVQWSILASLVKI